MISCCMVVRLSRERPWSGAISIWDFLVAITGSGGGLNCGAGQGVSTVDFHKNSQHLTSSVFLSNHRVYSRYFYDTCHARGASVPLLKFVRRRV